MHSTVERERFRVRDAPGRGQRVNARIEQALIRVDVAESRENLLV